MTRSKSHAALASALLPLVLIAGLVLARSASADPCKVAPTGGTVELPPAGCDYLSPDEVHLIIDGLPPGTTIKLAPIHKDFICYQGPGSTCSLPIPPGQCEVPGGALGGNGDCFDSTLELQVTGTGDLTGFSRTLSVPLFTEVHTGPRNPGDPVQAFPTEMIELRGDLFGDPDFDFLQIRAGAAHGLPSPGHTTLTELPSGNFNVDSFFDITYQIDFQGAPGSALEGMGGSTTAPIRMQSGVNPCAVVDNGTGTVDLPPAGCEYLSPTEVHEIINGLPPGTTIVLDAIHRNFICGNPVGLCSAAIPPGQCEAPGGSLGGNVDCFGSEALLEVTGTGSLAGFSRTLNVQLFAEAHTGPRNPGDPVQQFPNDMFRLEGQLFGDPDFCTFNMRSGTVHGLPSPGETRLTDLGDGTFQVDSFFDIAYEIDFVGCPGSALDGFGGTTAGSLRMSTGNPIAAPPSQAVPAVGPRGLLVVFAMLVAAGIGLSWRRRLA